jgi:hypothetical protein
MSERPNPEELALPRIFDWGKTDVKFPEVFKVDNYSELITKYASMNTPYSIMGVVLYNAETGERSKLRNPVYEEVKMLRGNQPKKQYLYISLRQQGKVAEYITFFPENKQDFSFYRDQIHLFTETLFENYVACYIKKTKPLIEYPEQYRTHMFAIHQSYIQSLQLEGKKFYVNKKFVVQYVNKLHPSLLMHSLNYHLRKNNIDEMKVREIKEIREIKVESKSELVDDFVIV